MMSSAIASMAMMVGSVIPINHSFTVMPLRRGVQRPAAWSASNRAVTLLVGRVPMQQRPLLALPVGYE
jgi:hypothetical protein